MSYNREPSYPLYSHLGDVLILPSSGASTPLDFEHLPFKRSNRRWEEIQSTTITENPDEVFAPEAELRKGPILHSSCGGGAAVLHLLKQGYDAHGADLYLSPIMRRVPRYFSQGDLRTIQINRRFFTILSIWGPLSFSSKLKENDPRLEQMLANLNTHLLPGGSVRIFPAAEQITPELAARTGFHFKRLSSSITLGSKDGYPVV